MRAERVIAGALMTSERRSLLRAREEMNSSGRARQVFTKYHFCGIVLFMSDIERLEGSDIENTARDASELTGVVGFNFPKYLERQQTIDEILSRDYPTDEARVADLNKHIEQWDDDFGISYMSMTGRRLPGLEIHGRAHALAFSANDAPRMNIEDAELDYAVMSLSVLEGLKAHGASLNHAIMPFVTMSGDLRGVSAIKAILNFAELNKLDIRGVDLTGAYLIATRGITSDMLQSVADASGARAITGQVPNLVLGDALSKFTEGSDDRIMASLQTPDFYTGVNSANTLFSKQNRNRTRGIIIDDSVISDGEISKLDFEGSSFIRLDASRVQAIKTNFAGLAVFSSKLDRMQAAHATAPGMVSVNSSHIDSELPAIIAGSVFINPNMRGASAENTQPGGALVIGGTAPELSEKSKDSLRVVQPQELPTKIVRKIAKVVALDKNKAISSTPKKELE